jgi:hypothetical protein
LKYDDASWHYGGEFPENAPEEHGGTHIALFMKWCFVQGLAGDFHLQGEPEDTQKVIEGKLSASEFLFKYCDGKLTTEDLNEEGNAFAENYYGDEGLYLSDYANEFRGLMYVASEQEHDFKRFSDLIEKRRSSGVLTKKQLKASNPWWKLW